jgi:hypothetical protein
VWCCHLENVRCTILLLCLEDKTDLMCNPLDSLLAAGALVHEDDVAPIAKRLGSTMVQ